MRLTEVAMLGFCAIFNCWGIGYLCATIFEHSPQTFAVVIAFITTLASGVTPSINVLMEARPLAFCALFSPNRWAQGYAFAQHFTGRSFHMHNLQKALSLGVNAFPASISLRARCQYEAPIIRFAEGDGNVCSVEPLIWLGISHRLLCLMLLIVRQNARANGGTFKMKGKVRCAWMSRFLIPYVSMFLQLYVFFLFLFLLLTIGFIKEF